MKTKPNNIECNYTRHVASSPFLKAELGKYLSTPEGKIVIFNTDDAPVSEDSTLKELIAMTCLSCGERWYIKVNEDVAK